MPESPEDSSYYYILGFATSLQKACEGIGKGADVEDRSGLANACAAFRDLGRYVEKVCNARSLQLMAMTTSPSSTWDYKRMLSADYHPIAQSLQVAREVKDSDIAQSPHLEDLIKHLPNFETVGSALKTDLLKDPLFEDLGTNFKSFMTTYVQSLSDAVKMFDQAHLQQSRDFIAEFTPVAQACDKWQMSPVAAFFGENSDKTKESLDQVIAAKENMTGPMAALTSFCSHKTSNKDIAPVLGSCKDAHTESLTLSKQVDHIAGLVVVAALLLRGDPPPSSADAKATQDMVAKTFGLTVYPAKMQKLMGDLLKTKDAPEKSEKQKEKSEKPEKKEKKRKDKDAEQHSGKKKARAGKKEQKGDGGASSAEE